MEPIRACAPESSVMHPQGPLRYLFCIRVASEGVPW
jgi:hypothetical protein